MDVIGFVTHTVERLEWHPEFNWDEEDTETPLFGAWVVEYSDGKVSHW